MPQRSIAVVHRESLSQRSGYAETHRSEHLSAGVYRLPSGHPDRQQQPHTEDEIYVIMRGRGAIDIDGQRHAIAPGAVIFVGAGVPHRFVDVTEDLETAVVFAPAERV